MPLTCRTAFRQPRHRGRRAADRRARTRRCSPPHFAHRRVRRDAAALDSTAALRQLAQIGCRAQPTPRPVDRRGTDLEAALDAARARAGAGPRAAHRAVQRRPADGGRRRRRGRTAGRPSTFRCPSSRCAVRVARRHLGRQRSTCPSAYRRARRSPPRSTSAASATGTARRRAAVRRQGRGARSAATLSKGVTAVPIDAVARHARRARPRGRGDDAGRSAGRQQHARAAACGSMPQPQGALRRGHAGERAVPVGCADGVGIRRDGAAAVGAAGDRGRSSIPTTSSSSATSRARRSATRR